MVAGAGRPDREDDSNLLGFRCSSRGSGTCIANTHGVLSELNGPPATRSTTYGEAVRSTWRQAWMRGPGLAVTGEELMA